MTESFTPAKAAAVRFFPYRPSANKCVSHSLCPARVFFIFPPRPRRTSMFYLYSIFHAQTFLPVRLPPQPPLPPLPPRGTKCDRHRHCSSALISSRKSCVQLYSLSPPLSPFHVSYYCNRYLQLAFCDAASSVIIFSSSTPFASLFSLMQLFSIFDFYHLYSVLTTSTSFDLTLIAILSGLKHYYCTIK